MTSTANTLLAAAPGTLWGIPRYGRFADDAHERAAVLWVQAAIQEHGRRQFLGEVMEQHSALTLTACTQRLRRAAPGVASLATTVLLATGALRLEEGLPPIGPQVPRGTDPAFQRARIRWAVLVHFTGNYREASAALGFAPATLRSALHRELPPTATTLAGMDEICGGSGWVVSGDGDGPVFDPMGAVLLR